MSDVYVGQILLFGGDFAPQGFVFCNGQLLNISDYGPLYGLLGTTYGGDGQTTFGVPDLRSRVPVHQGQGTGLSARTVGQTGGSTDVTLTPATMPAHTHALNASPQDATAAAPAAGLLPAKAGNHPQAQLYVAASTPGAKFAMASGACSSAGGGLPHANLMPTLGVSYLIATVGVFPSQS